jgi:hypothetical protein
LIPDRIFVLEEFPVGFWFVQEARPMVEAALGLL